MNATTLDAEELLHLGMNLLSQRRGAEALARLKQAATLAPENGTITYFVGAAYAEIDEPRKAVEQMKRAVELDPGLYIAGFQRGLICWALDEMNEAHEAWAPLDTLDAEHPLKLFKDGVQALEDDNPQEARRCIERGVQRNPQNELLNQTMLLLLKKMTEPN